MTDQENISLSGLIEQLKSLGVEIVVDGDKLKIKKGSSRLSTFLLTQIRQQKSALLKYYSGQEKQQRLQQLEEQDYYPLSWSQRRMWFLNKLDPNKNTYCIYSGYKLTDVEPTILKKSFSVVLNRHESLRTRFFEIDGLPYSSFGPVNDAAFHHVKVDSEISSYLRKIADQPLDILGASLFEFYLLESQSEFTVFLKIHHIIFDRKSELVFWRDLVETYRNLLSGKESLSKADLQYKDFVGWQYIVLNENLESQQQYWHRQFENIPPRLDLPRDFNVSNHHSAGRRLTKTFDFSSVMIKRYCEEHKVTEFMFFVAVLNTLFYKYTGTRDIVLGTPVEGRPFPELNDQIGLFINTLPIRVDFSEASTFEELLSSVKQSLIGAYENQLYPFDKLVNELSLDRVADKSPLFDVMIIFQNSTLETTYDEEPGVESVLVDNESTKFDFTFIFNRTENGFLLVLEYDNSKYSDARAERMFGHYQSIAADVLMNNGRLLAKINWLTSEENKQLLFDFNPEPEEKSVTNLAENLLERLMSTPDQVALVCDDIHVTRKFLVSKANKISAFLQGLGHQGDLVIGLMFGRSEKMVMSMLAALSSNITYVPVDPEYPVERIKYLIEDSQISALITDQLEVELDLPVYHFDSVLDHEEKATSFKAQDPDHIAYIIYTSGSTGYPKGVAISQSNLDHFIQWTQNEFGESNYHKLVAGTSFCFDLSVFEIYYALFSGTSIRLLKHAKDLISFLQIDSDLLLNTVPSLVQYLLDEGASFERVKAINMAGEPIPERLIRNLQEYKYLTIRNLYGPSEDTTYTTVYQFPANDSTVLIGRPVADTQILLLNDQDEMVPVGIHGELCISSKSLSPGYINRPELTHQKFTEHSEARYGRLYRTGDYARWDEEGRLHFLGRRDAQIKLRGYRIELGEIEKVLEAHPDVTSVVLDSRLANEKPGVVAYVIFETPGKVQIHDLVVYLKDRLPAFMVPSIVHEVVQIPRSFNGKVDYKQLRESLKHDFRKERSTTSLAATNEREQLLIDLVQDYLKIDEVNLEDKFFALGGDSILAMRLTSKLLEHGFHLDLKDFFIFPVLKDLAGRINKSETYDFSEESTGEVILLPIQRWFFDQQFPEPNHFNQAVTILSEEAWDLDVLSKVMNQLVARNAMLRVAFDAETRTQTIQEPHHLAIVKFESGSEGDLIEQATQLHQSLHLKKGELIKVAVFEHEHKYGVLISIHHLVVDGISWRILLDDFKVAYRQFLNGQEPVLPATGNAFQSWSAKIAAFSKVPEFANEKSYWEQNIHLIQEANCSLPLEEENYHTNEVVLDEANTDQLLNGVHQPFNTKVDDILLAALVYTVEELFEWKGCPIILEGHGRPDLFSELNITRTVGWFTCFYPLFLEKKEEISYTILNTKEVLRNVPNGGVGYGIMQEDFQTQKVHAPIGFNYLGLLDEGTSKETMQVIDGIGLVRSKQNIFGPPVHINAYVTENCLKLELNAHHLSKKRSRELINTYLKVLKELINYCLHYESSMASPSDFGYKGITMEELDGFFD